MTWYFWALLSMISGAFEEVIDKVIIIKNPQKIDALVASFYRNFGFFFFTILAGILGIFGKMTFSFNIYLLILALVWPLHSLAYDYFLRNIELSRFQGILYAFPILFLFVDKIYFHINYSILQVIGVVLLVCGALIFSFDSQQKKTVFSLKGIIGILIHATTYAYLLIAFKFTENSINEISFYFSAWLLVIIFYAILILITGKYKYLKETAITEGFLKRTFVSKGSDFLSSIFYLKALALATLTTVSAFSSFSPIILLIILLLLARFTKINSAENFSPQALYYKIAATGILALGGYLIFI
jgi:uncharacterized membrane protein